MMPYGDMVIGKYVLSLLLLLLLLLLSSSLVFTDRSFSDITQVVGIYHPSKDTDYHVAPGDHCGINRPSRGSACKSFKTSPDRICVLNAISVIMNAKWRTICRRHSVEWTLVHLRLDFILKFVSMGPVDNKYPFCFPLRHQAIIWTNDNRVRGWIRLVRYEKRYDDAPWRVIKWKHFPRFWPFVRGNHREGNPPITCGFPSQRSVTRSFDVFFDLRLNKRLSKQSRRRSFETPLRSLWRHCYGHYCDVVSKSYEATFTIYHGWWTSFRRNGVRNDLCDRFASTSGASLRRKSTTQEQILQSSK